MYNEVEHQFIQKSIGSGKTIVLAAPVAIEMIEACRSVGVPVLGLDAFRRVGDKIQPIVEESVDFSSPSHQQIDSWDNARAFIEKRSKGDIYFEVVCTR